MSHMKTDPNIYIDDESYVALKWDLSDLEEKCDHYLSRPNSMKRITRNAQDAYDRFYRNQTVLSKMEELIVSLALR